MHKNYTHKVVDIVFLTNQTFKLIVEKFQKTGRSSLLLKVNRNDDMLWVTIQYLDN